MFIRILRELYMNVLRKCETTETFPHLSFHNMVGTLLNDRSKIKK
uniref:Uncharacterized protein n=1 Tax=Anguilla anguilla TaxID=7936 RepID=A0A0E9QY77_ANGAN